jgi:LuxR family maltose regulon positive regulatory protein
LCDAVTGRDDSTALLQALERGYAFVSSLDQQHEWFRYHPLLREAMQNELRRAKPGRVPVLLDRAARWHEANGTLDEASRYALQAGNHEFLGHLIARHYLVFIRGGHQSELRSLLDAVDYERLGLTRAAVGFVAALEAGLAGSSETEIERHVAKFETVGFGDVLPTGIPSAEAGALFVRAAFLHGDLSRPRAAGERAIREWPDNRYLEGVGRVAIGYSHYLSGQLDAARVVLAPFGLTFDARRPLISIFGVSVRALLEVAAGNVRTGLVAARSAYRAAGRSGLTDRVSTAIAHEALAAALAASGDEAGALPLIERAVQLTGPNQPLQRASALLTRATILAGIGDRDGSIASAAEARTLVLASRDPGGLPMRVEAVMQPLMASVETAKDRLISSLTPAERSVLQLLPSSLSRREIAARLYVSPETVKTHSRRLYQKLGARTRSEAIETARGFGLIE